MQEPTSCSTSPHTTGENVHILAFESGSYRTDTDALFQAGRVSISGGGFREVEFHEDGFPSADVTVMSSVQSSNQDGFVKTRQQPGDSYGFEVALESETAVGAEHELVVFCRCGFL